MIIANDCLIRQNFQSHDGKAGEKVLMSVQCEIRPIRTPKTGIYL